MDSKSTVLFIGETGSGKSTVINYLANFFLGGSPTIPTIVIPNKVHKNPTVTGYTSAEANLHDQTMSQTTRCTTYVFERNSQVYAFIDTPGLSDTRGVEQDDANIQIILRAAGEAKSLRAIVLIINGSASRATVNVKNVLERMAGNLPDVLLKNLIVIFTHCSNSSKNFDESSLPILPAKSVAMDNSAFSTPPANWNPRDIRQVQFSWDSSMELIQEIITFIDELAPQSTQAFTQMLDNRERIRLNIDEAVEQFIKQQKIYQWLKDDECEEKKLDGTLKMSQLDSQQISSEANLTEAHLEDLQSRKLSHEQRMAQCLQQTTSAIQNHKQEYQRLQGSLYSQSDLTYTDTMKQIIRTPTDYYNTICTTCNVTCHENCGLNLMIDEGNSGFSSCACMGGRGQCGGCGCSISTHVHYYTRVEVVTITKQKFHEDRVRQNQENSSKMQILNQVLADLKSQELRNQADLKNFYGRPAIEQSQHQLNEIKARQTDISKNRAQAEGSLKTLQEQKTTHQNQIQDTKMEIQRAMSDIDQTCRELKSVCSGFNFVQELHSKKEKLQVHKSTLRDTQMIQETEGLMEHLDQLAQELTNRR